MKLKCFKVICVDDNENTYDVGVMAANKEAAENVAIKSLIEGRHIIAKVIAVEPTDAI